MASQYRVAVTSSSDFPVRVDIVQDVLGDLASVSEVNMPFRTLTPAEEDEYADLLADYQGILVRSGVFSERMLKKLELARVIAVHGAGVDQVDVDACKRLGIKVANAPGANANAVIELALGLMIDLVRRIGQAQSRVRRDGVWGEARHLGGELSGRTLGLIGLGRIGAGVAERARAFGMNVKAFDPNLADSAISAKNVEPCPTVVELLKSADVVSLHVPLVPETFHLINAENLAVMRPGALIVNTARGPLIDETALYRALASGHLGGAALDVMEQEPPNPANPLIALDSVIVTPHLGGSTVEALAAIARVASVQIRTVLEGGVPGFAVN